MSASQRNKGQQGEREAFRILSDLLGTMVRRNVDQARSGGADGMDIPGWAIEVKRQEVERIPEWWLQTVQQALDAARRPALVYRVSRQPWRVVVDLTDVCPDTFPATLRHRATISMDAFAQLVRERA